MREYVLVSYDISNPKRLQKVHKTMRGYGDGFQDSVFLCQISEKELVIMKTKLDEIIKPSEDMIVIIKLGRIDGKTLPLPEHWIVMGKKPKISDNSILIF